MQKQRRHEVKAILKETDVFTKETLACPSTMLRCSKKAPATFWTPVLSSHQSLGHLDLEAARLQNSEKEISSALNNLICVLVAAALIN